jgi:hypothetical protein
MKTSWIDTARKYKLEKYANSSRAITEFYEEKLFLNDLFEVIDTDVISLLPHQKITVKAMLDVESKRRVPVHLVNFYGGTLPGLIKPVIETSAAVLSEKVGSGKTFEILALILLQESPPKVGEISSLPLIKSNIVSGYNFKNTTEYTKAGFATEVRKSYSKVYRQTLIFVGKSVLPQWQTTITTRTSLRVFYIGDIHELRRFYKIMFETDRSAIDNYDIILVKNGNISGKFEVPELVGTHLDGAKNKPILNVFAELFKDSCFARVVLDDFDTLSIPSNATVIPSLFTWFVSATKRNPVSKRAVQQYFSIKEIVKAYRPTYINALNNRELFTFFNIGCDNECIDASVGASKIKYYTYTFVNPNDTFIGALGAMGTNDAVSFAEMFNADALKTAASKAGVTGQASVANIFEKILDNKWEIYKKNIAISKYIPKVRKIIQDLPNLESDQKTINSGSLDNLKKNIKKPGPISAVKGIVKYQQPLVDQTIDTLENENQTNKDENGKAIQRVKDNLRQGECPITCEPLANSEIVILRCCGVVISMAGAIDGLKIQKSTKMTSSACPNCRSVVTSNDIIQISREMNLDNIIEEEGILNDEETGIDELPTEKVCDPHLDEDIDENELDLVLTDEIAAENEANLEADIADSNKFNTIIKIIKGLDVSVRQSADHIRIPSLLVGNNDKGEPTLEERKVLIFASFPETLTNLKAKLHKHKINYAALHGTAKQISETVERYFLPISNERSIQVLLINGSKYCAGLNLQNTTDLVFTHKVMDQNVETQIAGRAARYGRVRNLNIHYVLYQNEYHNMFQDRNSA